MIQTDQSDVSWIMKANDTTSKLEVDRYPLHRTDGHWRQTQQVTKLVRRREHNLDNWITRNERWIHCLSTQAYSNVRVIATVLSTYSFFIMQKVIIHCNPSLTDSILNNGLKWEFSKQFGSEEIDVIVDNVEFETLTEDPDVLLCDHYGLDYDQVNCIELAWRGGSNPYSMSRHIVA